LVFIAKKWVGSLEILALILIHALMAWEWTRDDMAEKAEVSGI
jgi:hypothetical protein